MAYEIVQKLLNGIQVRITAVDTKSAFADLAALHEALGEAACGMCGDMHIFMESRTREEYTFYSWRCSKCGASLDMGQTKTGDKVYPKRTLPNGQWDSQYKGWFKWQDRKREAQSQAPPPAPAPEETPF